MVGDACDGKCGSGGVFGNSTFGFCPLIASRVVGRGWLQRFHTVGGGFVCHLNSEIQR
jgi:hypothetical protein